MKRRPNDDNTVVFLGSRGNVHLIVFAIERKCARCSTHDKFGRRLRVYH